MPSLELCVRWLKPGSLTSTVSLLESNGTVFVISSYPDAEFCRYHGDHQCVSQVGMFFGSSFYLPGNLVIYVQYSRL